MKSLLRFSQGLLLLCTAGILLGAKLYETRIYEPVVLIGKKIYDCQGIPVNELFVYAYKNNSWQMIPFQIDERVELDDPDLTKEVDDHWRHFYVIANTNPEYSGNDRADTNPLFDVNDELVFMIRDCGDKAPDDAWIDNEDAEMHKSIELKLEDPSTGDAAYVYVFQSSTLSMPDAVASQYGMQFNKNTHTAESQAYSVRMNQTDGLISDIVLKQGFGSGQDIFDKQKLRMNGEIWLGPWAHYWFGPEHNDANSANEGILYLMDNETYLAYTADPVVRVVREVRYAIGNNQLGYYSENTEFYVITKFYPYSGTFQGGTVLDPDSIKEALGTSEDFLLDVDYLRQSWDFSSHASGMQFFNDKNSQIVIDGNPDTPNKTVDIEGRSLQSWSLVTGNQGSLFNFYHFAETTWDEVSLYYWDNKNGYQMDDDLLIGIDTGYESGSYGDNGLCFSNTSDEEKALNLDFSFTCFFLKANQTRQTAEKLVEWINDTITVDDTPIKAGLETEPVSRPEKFGLMQNYPNPFNASTVIHYHLTEPEHVQMHLYDVHGTRVASLLDEPQQAGAHRIRLDVSGLASGVYFIRLNTSRRQDQKKMILLN